MKFEKTDTKYLEERKLLSEKYGDRELWSVMDHWPLYCGVSNFARSLSIIELLKSTIDVPGHIAEFGSWRGANLMLMAKVMRILDPMSSKVIYGFEGFEGLSDFDDKDIKASIQSGTYKGSYEELMDFIRLYEMEDEINIVKGNILETLPDLIEKDQGMSFSFVYCDTDLHATTKLILDSLHERLSTNGLFVLDEWNYTDWPGESVAAREFLAEHSNDYEMVHIRNTRQPSLALRKK